MGARNHPLGTAEGGRLKNYIVRIYRQDEKDVNKIIGVLEHVEEELQTNFSSMEELVKLLSSHHPKDNDILENEIRQAMRKGSNNHGPDWGEIRFEEKMKPGSWINNPDFSNNNEENISRIVLSLIWR